LGQHGHIRLARLFEEGFGKGRRSSVWIQEISMKTPKYGEKFLRNFSRPQIVSE